MIQTKYVVPSVEIALRILLLLKDPDFKSHTLTGIAKELKINKSTGYKILKTMQMYGFLTYNEKDKSYNLGPAPMEIGSYLINEFNYFSASKPFIEELVSKTRLTCATVVPTDNNLVVINKVEGNLHNFRLTVPVGSRLPITDSAAGRSYWTFLAEEKRKQLYNEGLLTINPESSEAKEIIDEVSSRGFSTSIDAVVPGTGGIASPVLDKDGEIIMILLSIGLSSDIKDRLQECGEQVAQTAQNISDYISGILGGV